MRTSGVTDVVGLHSNDHLCWPFDGFAEFRARAVEFLAAALHGCAQSNAATLVLRSEKATLARLVSLLRLKDVECVR